MAGNLMQRCRTQHLAQCGQYRRALLVGEGTGRFLAALLEQNPESEIVCVEQSQKMIGQIRRRLAARRLTENRVRFEKADFLTWRGPPASFDLIATHFFLDCFDSDQLDLIIEKFGRLAAPGANWLVSDFQIPAAGWRRWRAQMIVAALYQFFRVTANLTATELIPPDQWIERAGFMRRETAAFSFGLIHSDRWEKLKSTAVGGNHQGCSLNDNLTTA